MMKEYLKKTLFNIAYVTINLSSMSIIFLNSFGRDSVTIASRSCIIHVLEGFLFCHVK